MYNQINAPSMPAIHPSLTLVGYIEDIDPKEDVKLNIAFLSPAGTPILEREQDLTSSIDKAALTVGFVVQFQAVPLAEYGTHTIKLTAGSHITETIKLEVEQQ